MNRFYQFAVDTVREQGRALLRSQANEKYSKFLQVMDDFIAGNDISEALIWGEFGEVMDKIKEVRGDDS